MSLRNEVQQTIVFRLLALTIKRGLAFEDMSTNEVCDTQIALERTAREDLAPKPQNPICETA